MTHRHLLLFFVLLTFIGLGLRFWAGEHRPMHTDEAVNALVLERMLLGETHRYDPTDKHGPTLMYATYPVVRLLGITRLEELEEWHVRLVPALMGVILVWGIYWQREALGGVVASALAGALVTVGAPGVYYGAYWIHETLFILLTFLVFACIRQWWMTRAMYWAVLAGIGLGAIAATKETVVITLAAGALAGATTLLLCRPSKLPNGWRRAAGVAGMAAVATVVLVYSAGGRHVEDLGKLVTGAVRFSARAGGEGHEKPLFTYVTWLAAPTPRGWPWLGWSLLLGLALACAFLGRSSRKDAVAIFLASHATATLLLYSAIPYKTPWLTLNVIMPASLVAAMGYAALLRRWPRTGTGLLLSVGILLGLETERWCFRFPTDDWNPWAYVPTVNDAPRLQAQIERFASSRPQGWRAPVQVIGRDIWPLPWYLRRLTETRYSDIPPARLQAPVIVADHALATEVAARLEFTHEMTWYGLRPGVLAAVFLERPATGPSPVPDPPASTP